MNGREGAIENYYIKSGRRKPVSSRSKSHYDEQVCDGEIGEKEKQNGSCSVGEKSQ